MAITTYAQLQTAIAGWLHRDDLTTTIPDFITLAEARLNDMLLLKNMETESTLTGVVSQNYVALPTGFVSPICLWIIVDGERLKLDPALPQELPYDTSATQPKYWAIDGENIRFDCPLGSAYSIPLRYIKASNLSDSNTTNALLTKRPDIYLSGAIVEAARYMRSVDLFNTWEPKFVQATNELKAADSRNRSIVPLRTDVPITTRRANIFRGE